MWQWLETFLVVTTGKVGEWHRHLGHRGQGGFLTSYNAQESSPQQRTIWSQMSIVLRLREAYCGEREGLWNVRKET